MENRFSPEDWSRLSVERRLGLCASMARELREMAAPAAGDDYRRLADQWDALASEMAMAANVPEDKAYEVEKLQKQ